MKYKVLIAEDDVLIAESLKDHIEELGHKVIGIVSDIQAAKKILAKDKPDICFLDILMHGKKQGFTIAQYLNDECNIPFMFITSYSDSQTVKEASLYRPSAYLVKPFDETDVFTSLEVAMANQFSNQRIEVRDGYQKVLVNPLDIRYIKSDNNYIEIYTSNAKLVERSSLDGFVARLPNFFHKTHRSYVVNSKLVERISALELVLISGEKIPISKSFRDFWN